MYSLYTNNITNIMMWHRTRHNTFWDTAIQHKHYLIFAPNIFDKLAFLGSKMMISMNLIIQTASKKKERELKRHIYKHSVATTVGLPDLYLKWQLKNDGEASASSELLPHLSMTHGSDCHVAYVHQNSSTGAPVYHGWTHGWGGRPLPISTDPQP